jgi:hypothetical protein
LSRVELPRLTLTARFMGQLLGSETLRRLRTALAAEPFSAGVGACGSKTIA